VNRHPTLNNSGTSPLRLFAQIINGLLKGQANNQILVTFRDGETTTTIEDPRLGSESNLHLSALTANAATALAAGWWISARATGEMTITHANSADVDQTCQGTIQG
jgi:hypothetical protein